MIALPTEENIAEAARLLQQGELVSFPTETVYGLGANAFSEDACNKIFALKGRPQNNPLIVHVHSLWAAKRIIHPDAGPKLTALFEKLAEHWPGPLTIVVPKHPDIASAVSAGADSIGIRIPDHPITLRLLETADIPIAAPSANVSNYISPTSAAHVYQNFPEGLPIIIDGGETAIGIESTVISIINPDVPEILRPGYITKEALEATIGAPIATILKQSKGPQLSPGQQQLHYAPRTKIAFLSDVDLQALPPIRIGYIAFSEHQHLSFDFQSIIVLSHNNNLNEIASGLYRALHEMDHRELDLIVIDRCIESGVGIAIMDRLKKAVQRYRT